jgi:hypothetical protein
MDNQVKLRGYRIELGEIESVLTENPSISQAVVSTIEPQPEDKRLLAYIVLEKGSHVETESLRRYLSERLPSYMVPASFVFMKELPLNPSGKVDRQALPSSVGFGPNQKFIFKPPETPLEKVLARIWSEILQIEKVGLNDNFFELGGHSLLAVRLSARINEIFKMEVPLRAIFESPTLAEYSRDLIKFAGEAAEVERIAEIVIDLLELSEEEAAILLEQISKSGTSSRDAWN